MSIDRLKEASEWFVEWEAAGETTLPPELLQAWRQWAEDAGNLATFDRIVGLREAMRGITPPPLPTTAELARERTKGRLRVLRQRHWLSLAAAAGLAAATLIAFFPHAGSAPDYLTGRAEQRVIRMADGSTVTLGAQTALTMDYTTRERKVILKAGEALFTVAHEASRPFVVLAAHGSIRALGTTFVVKRDSDRVVVTVTDGRVEVASHLGSAARVQLARGEQTSYAEGGKVTAVKPVDPQAAVAWSRGRLVFDHEPLRYVVQAVNRYAKRQIVLEGDTGDLLYTGMVFPDQTDEWIQGLERIFPLEIVATDPEHVAVRAQPAR